MKTQKHHLVSWLIFTSLSITKPLLIRTVFTHFPFSENFRQEKEGQLTEAVKSFNEAFGLDSNQRTAKDHLEKIQQQIKLMDEVGGTCLLVWLLTDFSPVDRQ